jgi:cyclic pyranopterin phosphate synthase
MSDGKKLPVIDEERFCTIPFLQLQLNPKGNVSACCFSGEYKVGDVQTSTIAEIWNNDEMRRWRREFMDGDIKICAAPMKNFGCHKMFHHLLGSIEIAEVQNVMPKRLDLRLNGRCNLECVMCDVWRQPNELYDHSDLWTIGPEKIFPYLVEVDMLGGEPFIQKDTYEFIDAVSRVNQTCTWGFITNAHYRLTPHITGHLDRIKLRHIHMSLDSLDTQTYSQIRLKGDLGKVLATVDDYVAYRKTRRAKGDDFVLFASMCVQRSNWREIPRFLDFCTERELQPLFQSVIGMPELSLDTLSVAERQDVLAQLRPIAEAGRGYAVLPVISEVEASLARSR